MTFLTGKTVVVPWDFSDHALVALRRTLQQDAELIVISSHGRTGLTRLMLGSVAERVVRLAACPVLVLKNSTGKS